MIGSKSTYTDFNFNPFESCGIFHPESKFTFWEPLLSCVCVGLYLLRPLVLLDYINLLAVSVLLRPACLVALYPQPVSLRFDDMLFSSQINDCQFKRQRGGRVC